MSHADRDLGGKPTELEVGEVATRLHDDVHHLATEIGPRSIFVPEALTRSIQFLDDRFNSLGYQISHEEVDIPPHYQYGKVWIQESTTAPNIIAEKRGSTKPNEIVILGAHYDTPGDDIPGANDNGSGVAAMLEIARSLKGIQTDRTIRFVGFVNEEPPFTCEPCMGSVVSAQNSKERDENIVAMISLDEIGYYQTPERSPRMARAYPNVHSNGDSVMCMSYGAGEGLLKKFSRDFEEYCDIPIDVVFGESYTDSKGFKWPRFAPNGWSDHFQYLGLGYSALCVTDSGPFRYGAHYHTPTDTEDKLDYDTLAKVSSGLGKSIKSLVT